MSRDRDAWRLRVDSFPRVSGDEPYDRGGWLPEGVFSPRERG